jgi:hypothetical protein
LAPDTAAIAALERAVGDLLCLDGDALAEDAVGQVAVHALAVLGEATLDICKGADSLVGTLRARLPPAAAALAMLSPFVIAPRGAGAMLPV